jgi:hypothetical protein
MQQNESGAYSPASRRVIRSSPRASLALALGVALTLGSCAAPRLSEEPWVYALSRRFYSDSGGGGQFLASAMPDACTKEAAVVVLVAFALPFALDTALLPITVPHDLLAKR